MKAFGLSADKWLFDRNLENLGRKILTQDKPLIKWLSIRMSEHEIRYDSGQENSLSCHITWVHTQMTVASPALIHRSVLPKTIMLSFIPAFPWGMSIRVLPTRRKAFSRNHYHSSKNKDRRQNLGKNTDQWKFPKQFPPRFCISGYCPSNNHHHHKEGAIWASVRSLTSMQHF